MTPKTRTLLRRAGQAALIAATIWLAAPSIGQAYWLNGVWIAPDVPPYGYYQTPPPAYYGPYARHPVWVGPHWNGSRWVPGYWRTY
jgi:hypothetical protein